MSTMLPAISSHVAPTSAASMAWRITPGGLRKMTVHTMRMSSWVLRSGARSESIWANQPFWASCIRRGHGVQLGLEREIPFAIRRHRHVRSPSGPTAPPPAPSMAEHRIGPDLQSVVSDRDHESARTACRPPPATRGRVPPGRPTRAHRRASSNECSRPAARRAMKAAPKAAPSGTLPGDREDPTRRPWPASRAPTRVPPPLATMRRALIWPRSSMCRTTKPVDS